MRAPQAARKRMVLSLRRYLKKTRKRLGIVKTEWRWGTSLNYFTVDVFCELYSALSAA